MPDGDAFGGSMGEVVQGGTAFLSAEDLAADGCVYAEVRFAPELHTEQGLDLDAVIDMITFDPKTAENAVELFRDKVSHYLFCSTVCVYGGPLTAIRLPDEKIFQA